MRNANIELEMRPGFLSPATVALLLGGLLSTFGATKLQQEINLNANGLRAPGRLVDLVVAPGRGLGSSAIFEIAPPGVQPFRVQVGSASWLHDRDKGNTLNLVCLELRPDTEWCEVDTFADRWLKPMLLLVAGLPALAWGAFRIRWRRRVRQEA